MEEKYVRIFNRFWRNKKFKWINPTFGILSKLTYNHQIKYAKDNGFDFVFLSTEKNLDILLDRTSK